MSRSITLDRSTTFALVIIAEVQALLLYIAHRAGELDVALFDDLTFLTVWYSVVAVPPVIVSLQLRNVRDRFAWTSGALVAGVIALLAWHTGSDCGTDEAIHCSPVIMPYVFSMAIGHFILLPFIQGFREHGTHIPYSSLFHDSWDNALTLAATGFFVGAAWLILALWGALFNLVGIGFFADLFAFSGFIYPVTGLLAGFGVVLARHQGGALQAVLRLCLSLGRALLPLISILALVFLATLIFTGLQPLWDTKTATALLLLLIFGTVSLVNSVLHDGTGVETYRPALRCLLGAALLTLPVYAVVAAIALGLRVQQYAWTVDRLWAALLVFIAAAYSAAYATSVVVKLRGRWLGLLPMANVVVALVVVGALSATQSPLLDFRSITVSSQLARLDREGMDLTKFDFEYFRWELGERGFEALTAAKMHPKVAAAPGIAEKIQTILQAKNRWETREPSEINAKQLRVYPKGAEMPNDLLVHIGRSSGVSGADSCWKGGCVLVKVEIIRGAGDQWVLFDTNATDWASFPVYLKRPWGWENVAALKGKGPLDSKTLDALERGEVRTEPVTHLQDLIIGGQRFRLRDLDPWD